MKHEFSPSQQTDISPWLHGLVLVGGALSLSAAMGTVTGLALKPIISRPAYKYKAEQLSTHEITIKGENRALTNPAFKSYIEHIQKQCGITLQVDNPAQTTITTGVENCVQKLAK